MLSLNLTQKTPLLAYAENAELLAQSLPPSFQIPHPDSKSLSSTKVYVHPPPLQGGQDPPQSTPVSSPFWIPSLHVGPVPHHKRQQ